jgi:hypothetical protein
MFTWRNSTASRIDWNIAFNPTRGSDECLSYSKPVALAGTWITKTAEGESRETMTANVAIRQAVQGNPVRHDARRGNRVRSLVTISQRRAQWLMICQMVARVLVTSVHTTASTLRLPNVVLVSISRHALVRPTWRPVDDTRLFSLLGGQWMSHAMLGLKRLSNARNCTVAQADKLETIAPHVAYTAATGHFVDWGNERYPLDHVGPVEYFQVDKKTACQMNQQRTGKFPCVRRFWLSTPQVFIRVIHWQRRFNGPLRPHMARQWHTSRPTDALPWSIGKYFPSTNELSRMLLGVRHFCVPRNTREL